MSKRNKYKITGNAKTGFAVVFCAGGTEYDLIETRREAEVIRDLLNQGKPVEWDKLEPFVSAALATNE